MKNIKDFYQENMLSADEMNLINGGGVWRREKKDSTIDHGDGRTTTLWREYTWFGLKGTDQTRTTMDQLL